MIIEEIKIDKIIPDPNNPKIHPDKQVDKIKNSIKKFGFKIPVLINEDNKLIAGHGRLLAAKKLKLETIPAIRVEGLSEEELKAFMIADNKVAESDWDTEKLMKLFDGMDKNIIKITGFSETDLKKLNLDYMDLDKELEELQLGEMETINWTAKFRNEKDFEPVKEVLLHLKKKNKIGTFSSDYTNGVLLKLLCEDEEENAKTIKKLAKNYKKRHIKKA